MAEVIVSCWPLYSVRRYPAHGLCPGHAVGTNVVTPVSFYEGDHKGDNSSHNEHPQANRPSNTGVECTRQQEHAKSANSQKHTQKSHRFFRSVFLFLGLPFDPIGDYPLSL
jgi:hypothetical protein